MLRVIGFYQDFAGKFAATRASGYLCEQLEGSFGCSEIRPTQREIRRNHANQSHALEIATLCDPTRISNSPSANAPSTCWYSRFVRTVSRSSRAMRAEGNFSLRYSSTRSAPSPTKYMYSPLHFGHFFGGRIA